MKLLLVDDDESFASLLRPILNRYHYQVDVATNGDQGLEFLEFDTYDLVLLDLELPDMTGVRVCQRLRGRKDSTPILLLTSNDTQATKIQALDAGADDYLIKSSDYQELLARIRALLRRNQSGTQPILTWGALQLDPSLGQVSYQDSVLAVTAKEYEMLELFLRNPKQLFSAKTLLDRLWSMADAPLETAVRTHIKELRRKLRQAGADNLIETVRGLGYRLRDVPPERAQTPQHAQANHHSKSALQEDERVADPWIPETSVPEMLDEDLSKAWMIARPHYLDRLERMRAALEICDRSHSVPKAEWMQAIKTLRHEAHTLKGGLGSFGLEQLAQFAQLIHAQLLQQQTEDEQTEDEQTDNGQHRLTQLLLLKPILRRLQSGIRQVRPILEKNVGTTSKEGESAKRQASRNKPIHDSIPTCHWLLLHDTDLSDRLLIQAPADVTDIRCEVPTREALTTSVTAGQHHIIWLDLDSTSGHTSAELKQQDWFQMAQTLPQVSLVVLSPEGNLASRIQASELGCVRFGLTSTPLSQLWSMAKELTVRPFPFKLLIVDDDLGLLAQLEQDLAKTSVKFKLLSDPEQFWQVLEQVQPDVLVLDIEMSGITGIELCQAVRSDPHWRKLPVLFMSGYSDSITLQRLFEVRANDFLCKPVRAEALLKRALIYC